MREAASLLSWGHLSLGIERRGRADKLAVRVVLCSVGMCGVGLWCAGLRQICRILAADTGQSAGLT